MNECAQMPEGSGNLTTGCMNTTNGINFTYLQPPIDQPSDYQARSISIEPLNHGYIVTIGCQRFAATNPSKMLKKIGKYLENPAEVEKLWLSGKFKV